MPCDPIRESCSTGTSDCSNESWRCQTNTTITLNTPTKYATPATTPAPTPTPTPINTGWGISLNGNTYGKCASMGV